MPPRGTLAAGRLELGRAASRAADPTGRQPPQIEHEATRTSAGSTCRYVQAPHAQGSAHSVDAIVQLRRKEEGEGCSTRDSLGIRHLRQPDWLSCVWDRWRAARVSGSPGEFCGRNRKTVARASLCDAVWCLGPRREVEGGVRWRFGLRTIPWKKCQKVLSSFWRRMDAAVRGGARQWFATATQSPGGIMTIRNLIASSISVL